MRRRLILVLFGAALGVSSCAFYQELAATPGPAVLKG